MRPLKNQRLRFDGDPWQEIVLDLAQIASTPEIESQLVDFGVGILVLSARPHVRAAVYAFLPK